MRLLYAGNNLEIVAAASGRSFLRHLTAPDLAEPLGVIKELTILGTLALVLWVGTKLASLCHVAPSPLWSSRLAAMIRLKYYIYIT